MSLRHLLIGEVADRTRLSLRTIRYYEDMGLIGPAVRTQGGFRLYTEADVGRLMMIRRMKPLGFSLEEMRDLLSVLDGLSAPGADRHELVERLVMYRVAADARVEALREELDVAIDFAQSLRREIARQRSLPEPR